jgi:replicative DNA helicase
MMDSDNVVKLPNNEQAEAALLSTCITHPRQFEKVKDTLTPGDFYRSAHAWAWSALQDIAADGLQVGAVTLADRLERREQLDKFTAIGAGNTTGTSAIAHLLASDRSNVRDIDTLIAIIKNLSAKRQIFYLLSRHVEGAINGKPAPEIIKDIQAELGAIELITSSSQAEILNTSAALKRSMDKMAATEKGINPAIPTGLIDLDKLLGGWHKTNYITIAGRPGAGKTSLLLSTALHAAKVHKKRVGIFSLEMSPEEVMDRLLSQETGIPGDAIRDGTLSDEQWPVFAHGVETLEKLTIHTCQSAELDMSRLRTFARKMSYLGMDMLLVDYIGLITPDRAENRVQEVSKISRALKLLARELNIPLLAAAQMNRAIETRSEKEPVLSDLRESGSIEQDSDIVIFCYRPNDDANMTNLKVAKHRNGKTGIIQAYFDQNTTRFQNATTRTVDLNNRRDIA